MLKVIDKKEGAYLLSGSDLVMCKLYRVVECNLDKDKGAIVMRSPDNALINLVTMDYWLTLPAGFLYEEVQAELHIK